MDIVLGSKYEEFMESLKRRIRESTIQVLEDIATFHMCSFCGDGIEGKMMVLCTEEMAYNSVRITRHYAHSDCYYIIKSVYAN